MDPSIWAAALKTVEDATYKRPKQVSGSGRGDLAGRRLSPREPIHQNGMEKMATGVKSKQRAAKSALTQRRSERRSLETGAHRSGKPDLLSPGSFLPEEAGLQPNAQRDPPSCRVSLSRTSAPVSSPAEGSLCPPTPPAPLLTEIWRPSLNFAHVTASTWIHVHIFHSSVSHLGKFLSSHLRWERSHKSSPSLAVLSPNLSRRHASPR